MAAGFGSALMLIMSLIALVISTTFFLAYVGRCLTVVVEDTAAGNDEVTWPDEPLQDWILGVVVLAWLIAVWLVPLGFVLRLTRPAFLDQYPVLGVVLGALTLWLFFPIGVLSSLASTSRWNFIHWRIVVGMVRLAPHTALFYGSSLIVVAVGVGVWLVAIPYVPIVLVPVAALVGGVCILLYARLLGKLAQHISHLQPLKKPKPLQPPPELPPLEVDLVRVNDPWAAPQLQRPKKSEKVTPPPPAAPAPQPKTSPTTTLDDEWEEGGTYEMGGEPTRTGPTQSELYAAPPPEVEEEPEEEEEPTPRRKKKKSKKKVAQQVAKKTVGIVAFPFYYGSRRALVTLTIVGSAVGAVLQAFLSMLPKEG